MTTTRCLIAAVLSIAATTAQVRADLIAITTEGGTITNFYSLSAEDASLTFLQQVDAGGLGAFLGIEFLPDGDGYLLASISTVLKSGLDLESFTEVATLAPQSFGTGGLAVSPEGIGVATRSPPPVGCCTELVLFDPVRGGTIGLSIVSDDLRIRAIDFRSDGVAVGVDFETKDLWAIDIATGEAELIAPLAGVTGGEVQGITTLGDEAWITTLPEGDAPGALYEVDLFTGETSLVGQFPAGLEITGIAAIPAPSALGPLLMGALAARRRRRG